MHRSVLFGRQGQSRERKFALLPALIITSAAFTTSSGLAADPEGICAPVIGRIVSVQGSIEVQRAGSPVWDAITRLDSPVCEGDRLRTGRASRAAVFIQPENLVRLDQNSEMSLSHSEQETFLEFFQDVAVAPEAITQGCGAGYVITRFPKKFRIRTPHVNAAVEGTEFLVALRCDNTEVAVFEGKVRAQLVGSAEEKLLRSGQVLTADLLEPPAIRLLIKPADAVQWALYYPPLSDAGISLVSADECAQVPESHARQICFAQRAEHFLRLGRVKEAEDEIDQALAVSEATGEALALRVILHVVKNDREGALAAGRQAVAASPASSRTWLALAYAQQASFQLEDATRSVKRAAELEPHSSLVQARLAEMLMSIGRTRDAEKAAQRAVENNPSEERAHTVLGFVHLAQIKIREAKAAFLAAIERNSTAPLPRLGLGLALIRQGNLAAGREQLEIAVALDPTNSMLRSYVGKAYYEENTRERDQVSDSQFDLAKQFDPNDPTPWFYEAILARSQARTVEALENVHRSVELNDNRAVTRSRLLLDDDLAARSTSRAQLYRDLDFEQAALPEAYRALAMAPDDFSGHRLLANAFSARPRHHVAKVSESLQAQVWQPLNVAPMETFLIDDQSFILRGTVPGRSGFGESDSLFVQQGAHLLMDGVAGDNDTFGDQVVLSGLRGNVSASVSQFYYRTDGFQDGWGLKKSIKDAFVQAQLSSDISTFFEIRDSDQTQGDLSQNFFGPPLSLRLLEDRQLLRAGLRYRSTPAFSTAMVVTLQDSTESTEFPAGTPAFAFDEDESVGEVQTVYRGSRSRLILGGGHYRSMGTTEFVGLGVFPNSEARSGSLYAYSGYDLLPGRVGIEVGLSAANVRSPDLFPETLDQVSPKFGVVVHPWRGTTVRAAAFRTFARNLIADQTMEPTQVAGFNQFYDDSPGTDSRRAGVGIDQRFAATLLGGVEASRRRLKIPQLFTDPLEEFEWREQDYRAYLYWAPTRYTAVSADYLYEKITAYPLYAEMFLDVETHKLPIGMQLLSPSSGVSLQLTLTGVRQSGQFRVDPLSAVFADGESDFWLVDMALSCRLPRRRGLVTLEARNLFDRGFNYQETDILTPTLARGRMAFARLTLSID